MVVKKAYKAVKADQLKTAPRAVLEDLFEDYYNHRNQLYWMNLFRGIFFGFGSVIGGTLVVALLLWLLSVLHYVPFLNSVVDAAKHSLSTKP